MATRAQIDRLAQRIEALATRNVPFDPPEAWVVNGDQAYLRKNPDQVITVAELKARPTGRSQFPTRIVRVVVDPVRVEGGL
jgi:hypothetical protein